MLALGEYGEQAMELKQSRDHDIHAIQPRTQDHLVELLSKID